jgi:hypothetical protein
MSSDPGHYAYLPLIDRPKLLETILAAGSAWPAIGIDLLDLFRTQAAR